MAHHSPTRALEYIRCNSKHVAAKRPLTETRDWMAQLQLLALLRVSGLSGHAVTINRS
jgi:hypothetical protein